MPKSNAVWGIDIGNCALKALRCRLGDAPDEILAEAFDYIEYPKILSEPGAEPGELVADAIKQFLKRNTLKGDRVVLSVPGQNGLARFIKLPPVELKKVPAIVAYEARQQIPFALEDVVWDYQQMPGSTIEEGFALEAEVGLFAMKREQVDRALEPLVKHGVEVEMVQLAPLALYNFLVFDQMRDLPPEDEYIPDAPPPSLVILSMGTEASDLVITNGFRVWQRSIPLGGNHFTRALTKELKLTFAKAEHLKRNATAARDPKAVFQAMRPAFSDLVTEVHRSITYFTTVDRAASIDYVVGLGNAMRLPGLRKYLSQSLNLDVKVLTAFRGLKGDEVVNAPVFRENLLSFATAYGLVVQGVAKAPIKTNLLPGEILKEREVKAKKPWAVAAVAMLLLALTISFVSYTRALGTVDPGRFQEAEPQLKQVASRAAELAALAADAKAKLELLKQTGTNLTSNVEGRLLWLELLKAVNACLPSEPEEERLKKKIWERNELFIENIACQHVEDVNGWYSVVKENGWYQPGEGDEEEETPPAEAEAGMDDTGADSYDMVDPYGGEMAAAPVSGPTGPGFIVQIRGYHYHNRPTAEGLGLLHGAQFIRETLIANLAEHQLMLPTPDDNGEMYDEEGKPHKELVSLKDLGIRYPALFDPGMFVPVEVRDPNVEAALSAGPLAGQPGSRFGGGGGEYGDDESGGYAAGGGGSFGGFGGSRGGTAAVRRGDSPVYHPELEANPPIKLLKTNFRVEFIWRPVLPSERRDKKKAAAALAAAGASSPESAEPGAMAAENSFN